MSLNGNITANILLTNTKDNVDLSTPAESVTTMARKNITSGYLYHDTLSLSGGEVKQLNIYDGSLLDVYGTPITISELNGFYAKPDSDNTGNMVISGAGVDIIFKDLPQLKADQGFLFGGDVITSGGVDTLEITALATSGMIDIVVFGV